MNSTGDNLNVYAEGNESFCLGGIMQTLDESDLIVIESTFNVRMHIDHKTKATGLILAESNHSSNVNVTNCDVNYTIKFADSSYARSPGVLGAVV